MSRLARDLERQAPDQRTWSYIPCEDCCSYFEFPDDFEFGTGDDDDRVFDLAWAAMRERGLPGARFDAGADLDALEAYGAVLIRDELPEVGALRRTAERMGAAKSLPMLLDHLSGGRREAVFSDHRWAMIAALRFDGKVLS